MASVDIMVRPGRARFPAPSRGLAGRGGVISRPQLSPPAQAADYPPLSANASTFSFGPGGRIKKITSPLSTSVDSALMGAVLKGSPDLSKYLIPPPAAVEGQKVATIVFDLDETLCSNRRIGRAILRPGACEVLKSLSQMSNERVLVEVVLWTASMEVVARPVVARLDPDGKVFTHHIFRDKRWYKETGYTKDLRRLGRDMASTVIIENSPMSVTLNRRNAILVKDFLGGPGSGSDKALFAVREVLEGWIDSLQQNGVQPTSVADYLSSHRLVSRTNEILASPSVTLAAAAVAAPPAATTGFAPTTTGAGFRGGVTRRAISLPRPLAAASTRPW